MITFSYVQGVKGETLLVYTPVLADKAKEGLN
jgi:hypothetical protein